LPTVANTTAQLQRLVETAARKHGVPENLVERLAADAVCFIVETYGGRRVFIPMFQQARVAQNAAILSLVEQRIHPREIARRLKVSRERVRQYARPVQDELILELIRQRVTPREIAPRLGVSLDRVLKVATAAVASQAERAARC
jgi:hypothetical protein